MLFAHCSTASNNNDLTSLSNSVTRQTRNRVYLLLFFIILLCFPHITRAQHRAEVIHWWVSGSENAALEQIVTSFEAKGNQWVDTAVESSYYAKTAAISRINNNKSPTAVQWHTGVSLVEIYQEGLIRDLNDLASDQQWRKVLPTAIRESISVDGKIVAVPITLHSSNWMWASKKILAELNLTPPKDWQEFLQMAPKISAAGYTPLALGGQAWQERALFLPIVLGTGGRQLYVDAFVDHRLDALSSPEMINAFEVFGRLRQYIDPESKDRNWSDTTKLVIDGKAAFQIMGDWVKGEFLHAGMEPEKDFMCTSSPGSKGMLLLVSDAFAMVETKDEKTRASQTELALTMMDKDVQKALNLIKGAIPPRTDITIDEFDTCAQLAMQVASVEGATLPGFSMANTGIVGSSIMSVISKFWNDPELTPKEAADMLAAAVKKAKL